MCDDTRGLLSVLDQSRSWDLLSNPWMTRIETAWLIMTAKRQSLHRSRAIVFVEVGTWKGITTRNIAKHCPDTIIYAVDHFKGSGEHADNREPCYEPNLNDPRWLRSQFDSNVKIYNNVRVIALDSLDAAQSLAWKNVKCDIIFLDGSHEYDDVKKDIAAWSPLLSPNGIICGHDYLGYDVNKAVDELIPHRHLIRWTNIWSSVESNWSALGIWNVGRESNPHSSI